MSRRHSDRPQFMDPRTFRSSIQNIAYIQDPDSATLLSARALPRVIDRNEEDYLNIHCAESYGATCSARSPLDRTVYEQAAILTDREHIRSRNIQVQLANAALTSVSRYAEIHPKICLTGHYPAHFRMPMQLTQLVNLDDIQLQWILADYDLDTTDRFRGVSRQDQICALLEYLGAMTLARLLRPIQRRTALMGR